MANIRTTGSLTAALGTWMRDTRRQLREERKRRRIYSETYNELRSLSDRELADIGISRADLVDIARDAAYGDR
jgi:uncharacterized protein YjiS (DUF1127 family)